MDFLVERDLTRHTRLTYKAWSLESRKNFERHGRCLPDPNNPTLPFDNNSHCPSTIMQVASVGPQLDVDYRDNPFLPTRGSFTRLNLDYSNPRIGSSRGVEFYKVDGGFTYYKRIGSPRIVWANAIAADTCAISAKMRTAECRQIGPLCSAESTRSAALISQAPLIACPKRERAEKPTSPTVLNWEPPMKNSSKTLLNTICLSQSCAFPSTETGAALYSTMVGQFIFQVILLIDRIATRSVLVCATTPPSDLVAFDIAFKIRPENNEDVNQIHFSIGTF